MFHLQKKMKESIKMFRKTIGIDPIQQWRVILQKIVPIFKYYMHDNKTDETASVLLSFLDKE